MKELQTTTQPAQAVSNHSSGSAENTTGKGELHFSTDGWQEITLKVRPLGKGPAKYGENVFRFGTPITLHKALVRHGWEIIHRNASHVYARPPHNAGKAPYSFSFHIPSKEQVLEIADKLFSLEKTWAGIIGEWMVICLHEQRVKVTEVYSCIRGEGPNATPREWGGFTTSPSIEFGDSSLWSAAVYKRGDDISYHLRERFLH